MDNIRSVEIVYPFSHGFWFGLGFIVAVAVSSALLGVGYIIYNGIT